MSNVQRPLLEARSALRRLKRSPGFSAVAVLTLAMGIGANALIFSVVSAAFLRPLSYPDADRLVWVTEFVPRFNRTMAPAPDYAAWKQQARLFEQIEAMRGSFGTNLSAVGRPAERVQTAHVTPGFFAMIGISPRLGVGFEANAGAGHSPVAIISDALWRGYFQADSAILGKSLLLDGKPVAIAGVMPPGFVYPDGLDVSVWLPDALPAAAAVPARNPQQLRVIGRLKADVTPGQARAEIEGITRAMDHQYPTPWAGYHAAAEVRVIPLQKQLTAGSETAAIVLMLAVGFLLLIACANVANLFLARAVTRQKEIAMRIAVGAGRRDIIGMLLLESLLLGGIGGLAGATVLFWGRGAVMFLMPKALGPELPLDWRVLLFTAGCSVATGLLFGLTPAWEASRVDVNSALKQTAIRSGGRLPAILAASQIALSLVLLAGAGLLIRSFLVLSSTDPGFDARNILTATAMLRPIEVYGPERQAEYCDRMLAGIEKLPGVRYAAVTSSPPMVQFSALETGLRADDGPPHEDTVSLVSVSGQYFQALGIRLVAGRFFDARDGRDGAKVAIVNETLARLLFPGKNPVGHRINSSVTIVGVVADIRHRALDDKVWPELFLPFDQSPSPWITMLVRGSSDPSGLAGPIRRLAQSVDSTQPLFDIELLEHRVSESLAERRQRAIAMGVFAGLALLIAWIGIYSVISYSVARRTHEIGLRMALGAARREVLRMVIASGMRIAAFGIAAGLAGAVLVTRFLRSFLYGVQPTDPATLIVVCACMAAAAFLASYLPAMRATKVDPMTALRRD